MTGFQRSWHLATAAVVAVAVVGQLISSASQGRSIVNFFSYFTIQSNLLILVAAVVLARGSEPSAAWWRVLRLAGLTGITVTFLVFAVLIGPHVSLTGVDWWYDKGLHYVSPLMAVTGFVIGPRPALRWSDLAFIGWPVAWLAYTLVRGLTFRPSFELPDGSFSPYPYDFLAVDVLGAGRVSVTIVVITVLMLVIATGYIAAVRRQVAEPVTD